MNEFRLINLIKEKFPRQSDLPGIGDDCAVIPQSAGEEILVSTDMLLEGVHFLKEAITPQDLGWKSAGVNLSDIAAMGGRPVATFLSLGLPNGTKDEWIEGFIEGYAAISREFACPLLGGDTNSSKGGISINVTVLGSTAKGKSIKRSGAKRGDGIYVSGPLGDSAAGLRLILENRNKNISIPGTDPLEKRLIERHHRPVPRINEGLLLSSLGAVGAMMDISDGIASDLPHILEESGVGAIIDTAAIPLSEDLREICRIKGWNPLKLALEGGEDYELLFSVSASKAMETENAMHRSGHDIFRIGEITSDKGCLKWNGTQESFRGFMHTL